MFDLDDECVIIGLCVLVSIALIVIYPYLEQMVTWAIGIN